MRIDLAGAGITLLLGPAGAGKTTALQLWHRDLQAMGRQPVWLTLDPRHNGAGVLAADLARALQPDLPLILDGLDRLNPAAQELLVEAVSSPDRHAPVYLSDQGLRGTALADLWLRGGLRVIGPDALRLSPAEAGALLDPIFGAGDAAALARFCDGWAAGLAMLAQDPAAARRVLGAAGEGPLPDAMVDWFELRLCGGWSAAQRRLLRDLAVLRRFTPDVLPALPAHPAGASDWALIAPLATQEGFVRAAPSGSWFTLHPALALHLRQDLLRHDPGRATDMRRFAAEWFSASGLVEEAARHAVSLPDWPEAARIIEAAGAVAVDMGHGPEAVPGQAVPPGAAAALPLVFFGQIYWRIRHGRTREAEIDYLEACRLTGRFGRITATADPVLIHGWLHLFDAIFDAERDRPVTDALIARLELSLRETLSSHPVLAVALSSVLAYLYLNLSRHREAAAVCRIGLGVHQSHPANTAAIFVRQHQASLALASDTVEMALLYIEDAARLAALEGRAASYEVLTTGVHHAVLLFESNDLARARDILEQVVPLLPAVNGWVQLWSAAYATLATIRARMEGVASAEPILQAGEALADSRELPRLSALLALTRMQILMAADPRAAGSLLDRAPLCDLRDPAGAGTGQPALQVPLQLAEAELLSILGRMHEAQAVLERINRPWLAEADQRLRFGFLVLAMRVNFALRRYNGAMDCLEDAVNLARRAGLIRRSLDARGDLVALLDWAVTRGRPVSAPVRDWIDSMLRDANDGDSGGLLISRISRRGSTAMGTALSLSPRESEIMLMIAEGLITKEIARKLGISEGTVKGHRKKIHEKLGVRSRSQAILRARELLMI